MPFLSFFFILYIKYELCRIEYIFLCIIHIHTYTVAVTYIYLSSVAFYVRSKVFWFEAPEIENQRWKISTEIMCYSNQRSKNRIAFLLLINNKNSKVCRAALLMYSLHSIFDPNHSFWAWRWLWWRQTITYSYENDRTIDREKQQAATQTPYRLLGVWRKNSWRKVVCR